MEKNLPEWMRLSGAQIGLEIPAECEAGVLENLERNFIVAEVLLERPLAATDEVAAVFEP